jgi:hypothetical protein
MVLSASPVRKITERRSASKRTIKRRLQRERKTASECQTTPVVKETSISEVEVELTSSPLQGSPLRERQAPRLAEKSSWSSVVRRIETTSCPPTSAAQIPSLLDLQCRPPSIPKILSRLACKPPTAAATTAVRASLTAQAAKVHCPLTATAVTKQNTGPPTFTCRDIRYFPSADTDEKERIRDARERIRGRSRPYHR